MPNLLSYTHANDLALTRSLVTTLISALEKEIITPSLQNTESAPAVKTVLWGEKENAVGALVKLTTLLLKVIPLEQQLAGNPIPTSEETPLPPEDEAIIARYMARVNT